MHVSDYEGDCGRVSLRVQAKRLDYEGSQGRLDSAGAGGRLAHTHTSFLLRLSVCLKEKFWFFSGFLIN